MLDDLVLTGNIRLCLWCCKVVQMRDGLAKMAVATMDQKALDNLASVNPHALQRSQKLRSCKLRKR